MKSFGKTPPKADFNGAVEKQKDRPRDSHASASNRFMLGSLLSDSGYFEPLYSPDVGIFPITYLYLYIQHTYLHTYIPPFPALAAPFLT